LSHGKNRASKNAGGYVIVDQSSWQLGKGMVYGWIKSGLAPGNCNVISYFNGGGLLYQNPFGKGNQDIISLAFANAIFCREFLKEPATINHETAVELTLRKQWHYFAVQPDFQYIFNPSGSDTMKNPICFILRIQATL
jgi:carbohydrate-selective porin OprB